MFKLVSFWNSLSFLSDYNYGKRGSSQNIPGFPQHSPFSFSAKNRELWVSWNCWFCFKIKRPICGPFFFFVCGKVWFPVWRTVWPNFDFSSLRSFDTESEELRSVVLGFLTCMNMFVQPFHPSKIVGCTLELHPSCRLINLTSVFFSKLSHQPVMLHLRDPYLLPSAHGEFQSTLYCSFKNIYLNKGLVFPEKCILPTAFPVRDLN